MGASSKYEEFQEMLEQQKTMYLQQNNQLARYNSSLMMKITDLETKISELVQENVKLRSRLSMGELKYRERMNRTVETVERGVMDRLDEISRLFVDLRRQESIAADGMERAAVKEGDVLSLKLRKAVMFDDNGRSENGREMERLEEEQDDDDDDNNNGNSSNSIELNDEEVRPLAKKCRKSSRRESLFIPADFEFNNEKLELELNELITKEKEQKLVQEASEESSETEHQAELPLDSTQDNVGEDDSYNFNTSVIEYSIPEESNEHSRAILDTSKSKIEVYNDREELAKEPDESLSFIQCQVPSQSKIKHSMKHPRTKLRGTQDDVMPHTEYDKDEKRERRTRGKAVNYKLPSLRAKMRRPTEKLVDATTVTDIHDLQVKQSKKEQLQNILREKAINVNLTRPKSPEKDSKPIPLKEVSPNANHNNINTSIHTSLQNVQDAQNLNNKLLVRSILNDSPEKTLKEPSNSGLDLTAFEIIDGISLKHAPKTHRAKAKEDLSRKRKRIHNEELSI